LHAPVQSNVQQDYIEPKSAAAKTKQFRELSGQDAAHAFHVIGVVGHTPGDLDSEQRTKPIELIQLNLTEFIAGIHS